MVHFEPLLIAALDFLGCRTGRKAECFSFGFQYLELSLLGADPRLPLPIGFASIQRFAEPERTEDGNGVSVAALTLFPGSGAHPSSLLSGNGRRRHWRVVS